MAWVHRLRSQASHRVGQALARLVGKRDEPIQTYPGRDGSVVSSPEIGKKTAQCFLPDPDLQYGQGYVGELEGEALIRKLNSENTDYAT